MSYSFTWRDDDEIVHELKKFIKRGLWTEWTSPRSHLVLLLYTALFPLILFLLDIWTSFLLVWLHDHIVVGSIRLKRKLSAICRRRGKYKKERKTFVRVRERERNKKWRRALYKSVLLTVKCVLGDFQMERVRYIKEWKKKKERR